MMNDTLETILAVAIFVIIILTAGAALFAGIIMIGNSIYAGTVDEYEGTIQTITRSSFLAPHTDVVMRTYSEDAVHFTLHGYHDGFEVGQVYKVSTVRRLYVYGLVCWGAEPEITVIENPGEG